MTVTDDLAAMLSMRYEGGDSTRPFVDATVLSRPVANEDLASLTGRAVTAFGPLRPAYLRLWSAESAGHFADTVPDKRFLAAPILDLRAGQQPVPAELSVVRAQSLDGYALARVAYADVDRQHPGHTEQAALQAADDLEESMAAGTLFDVMVDGEWAGLLAATDREAHELTGVERVGAGIQLDAVVHSDSRRATSGAGRQVSSARHDPNGLPDRPSRAIFCQVG